MSNLFRQLPAVDKLLREPGLINAARNLSIPESTQVVRRGLNRIRQQIAAGKPVPDYGQIVSDLSIELELCGLGKFQTVINATGVLLHTNLGRAPLPRQALDRLAELSGGYFNLELDLETGERGSRYTNVAKLFNLLSGAEQEDLDTVVVNNNAGAVLVALQTLAAGHEVIVSRGELVEIGGGFRLPEVIAASGCFLKEVGTTNRTRLKDYEAAISPQTKAILLVHPSNYQIIGFTETVPRDQLSKLAAKHGLLLIEDLGAGAFAPFPEPSVPTALKSSHLVTYSGDKLLGGAQAGVISGRSELVSRIKKAPLLRALRIDKLSLIVLETVLELHLNKEHHQLPLQALATLSPAGLKTRAEYWLSQLGAGLTGAVLPTYSTMGGGSLPGDTIPTWALTLHSPQLSSTELADWLRKSSPSIIGRIAQDRLWLDPRTVFAEQDQALLAVLEKGVPTCS